MRIIPVATLLTLLLTVDAAKRPSGKKRRNAKAISSSSSSSTFTCNEPFMIPAQYVDLQGNSFAMCLSDPKFHKNRLIWYIQEMNGPYKAIGVAARHGGDEFEGAVLPIEKPAARSGMHADPVKVKVHLDRASGVISIEPANSSSASMVNWIIKPNGFPAGTLKVPTTCGPFLKKLKDPKLLAPLTGADSDAKVCIIHGHDADAFISWGSVSREPSRNNDPLALEDDSEPTFFSLGFVGADRGVSIDLCDRGDGLKQRCEMSRLVGHVRKTFIVGDDDENGPARTRAKSCAMTAKKRSGHAKKAHRHHRNAKKAHRHAHNNKVHRHVVDEQTHRPREHVQKRHHKHAHRRDHESRSRALIAKINKIERNIHSILERAETPAVAEEAAPPVVLHRHEHVVHNERRRREDDYLSDLEDISDATPSHPHPHPHRRRKSVKQHRVKECSVKHPLLRPEKRKVRAQKRKEHRPRHKEHTKEHEALLMRRFQKIHQKMAQVEDEITSTESFISRKLEAFNSWLNAQKAAWEDRAKDFTNFLQELKMNVVYTPKNKKSKKSFLSSFGKTLRGGEKTVVDGLFEEDDDTGIEAPAAKSSIFSPFKKAANSIDNHVLKPSVGAVGSVASGAGNLVSGTAKNAGNIVSGTAKSAGNIVSGSTSGVGCIVSGTVNGVSDGVENTLDGSANLVDGTVRTGLRTAGRASNAVVDPIARPPRVRSASWKSRLDADVVDPSNTDRFDFNDDLISPSKARLARSPGVGAVAANPLGPVGPVLPPPAVKTFHGPQDPSVRAAYDYLN